MRAMAIESIQDIVNLARSGFSDWASEGDVFVKERGPLMLFSYSPAAQYAGRWNFFERVSRGLIINRETGEIVARPFDKFFNWGEGGRYTAAGIEVITGKLDGSLGILYRENGSYRIATRGSFGSEQAEWATEFLNRRLRGREIHHGLTLMFEIIYPANRVVVDYGSREDLVLLAARNRFTGRYVRYYYDLCTMAILLGFSLPRTYKFQKAIQVMAAAGGLGADAEGWVIEFKDGQRFKVKGAKYLELHRLVTGLSFNNTLRAIQDGNLASLLEIIPEEFRGQVDAWVDEIETAVSETERRVRDAFAGRPAWSAPKNRKDFAAWALADHEDIAPYLFAMLDGKDIRPLMLQRFERAPVDN